MSWTNFEWPSSAQKKRNVLEAKGMRPVGIVMADESGKRATIDRYGRVQWWVVDGSGKMIAADENK